jgi:hypothetical protein
MRYIQTRVRAAKVVPYTRPPNLVTMGTIPTKADVHAARKKAEEAALARKALKRAQMIALNAARRKARKDKHAKRRKEARKRAHRQRRAIRRVTYADENARRCARRASAAAQRAVVLVQRDIADAIEPARHIAAVNCVIANAASERALAAAIRASTSSRSIVGRVEARVRERVIEIRNVAAAACEAARAAAQHACAHSRPVTRMAAELRWAPVVAAAEAGVRGFAERWRRGFRLKARRMTPRALRYWAFERQHLAWRALDALVASDALAHRKSAAGKRHAQRLLSPPNYRELPPAPHNAESYRRKMQFWNFGKAPLKKAPKVHVETPAQRYQRERREQKETHLGAKAQAVAEWRAANAPADSPRSPRY